jgi:hypothetical protein
MENIEEFSKKYSNTWIRYKSATASKELRPAFIRQIDFADMLVYLEVVDLGKITVRYSEAQFEEHIELGVPKTGYFNHNGFAFLLYKTPARQWARGFCNTNHEIYNPFKKLLNDPYQPSFGISTVTSIFKRTFPKTPDESLKCLETAQSVALSRHIMLSKSPLEDKFPLVWFDANPVGFVKRNKFVIEEDVFSQEIQDDLRRMGHMGWIS